MLKRKLQTLTLVAYIQVLCILWKGFLKGLPNVLSDTSYDFLKQQDGYFVRIKIIKLNKYLDFPLTSKINEESGVRDFINEMDNGIIYNVDEVGLEEILTYHEAEFEIIDGYYYGHGRNKTINHVIGVCII